LQKADAVIPVVALVVVKADTVATAVIVAEVVTESIAQVVGVVVATATNLGVKTAQVVVAETTNAKKAHAMKAEKEGISNFIKQTYLFLTETPSKHKKARK